MLERREGTIEERMRTLMRRGHCGGGWRTTPSSHASVTANNVAMRLGMWRMDKVGECVGGLLVAPATSNHVSRYVG